MPPSEDSFVRLRPNYPPLVFIEGDIDKQKLYNIKRLLNRRIKKKRDKYITKYLLRWKGYRVEYNTQYNIEKLSNTKDLITDYKDKLQQTESLVNPLSNE